ncbi:hypothetical protein N9A89_07200, partial [Akkermansiaceae bacterium]|nr:hypothetical protein [Akkermansiaceae bacterium]
LNVLPKKMSKHETWRTRLYWNSVGGLLIEEFRAIQRNLKDNISNRDIDGIIVLDEPKSIQHAGTFDFNNRDLIVVQTKPNRLGMGVMGQVLFSKEIMRRFNPRSMKLVVVCGRIDVELAQICEEYEIEVIVIPDDRESEGRGISPDDYPRQNKAWVDNPLPRRESEIEP